jgi:hypothetical protein
MPTLLDGLENLRNMLSVEERKLLDILIRIAREFADGDTWHALEVRQVFEPLTRAQVENIVAPPGVSQIIVKGDPPAQGAYVAYPIPPNSGSGNGNGRQRP